MKLGILGGSFNPIHYGHLLMAEWCREAAQLDQVWFMPVATAPHKRAVAAPGEVRAALIEAAIADNPAFQASRLELDRGGLSYTVDTLRALARQRPEAECFLLLGADMLADLPNWREPEEICRLASILAVRRSDAPEPDFEPLRTLVAGDRLEHLRQQQVAMPLVDLSSTEIRRRVAAGQSLRYQTPPAVIELIARHGLYRGSS